MAVISPLLAIVNLVTPEDEAVKRSPVPFWSTMSPALARVAAVLIAVWPFALT